MSDIWYPISAMRLETIANVAMMIRWSWFEGRATYLRRPQEKLRSGQSRYAWATVRDGDVDWLPGKYGRDWPPMPHCFQPIGEWTRGALPDPLPSVDARLFSRIDDAGKRSDRQGMVPRETTGKEWWRDPLAIAYQAPGSVTLRNAEGRLMRALANCGAGRVIVMSSHIASEVYKAAIEEQNAGGPGYELLPSFRPHMIATPTDVSDFLVAMGWYTSLNPPELWNKSREPWAFNLQQNVLRWRALPLPMTFGEIADKKKVSYQRIQQLYHDGIDKVMRVANGHAAHDYLTSSPP